MNNVEKHIEMDKILTLNFEKPTIPLVDSGLKFGLSDMKYNPSNSLKQINWLEVKGFNYMKSYDISTFPAGLKKYHTITINMDPSNIKYTNDLEMQKSLILSTIDTYSHKIKYLALIYEYGRSKLHWHMLISIVSVKEVEKSLQEIFGKTKYSVRVKKVEPNNKETLLQNLHRILNYFKKEDHNKSQLFLSKTKVL